MFTRTMKMAFAATALTAFALSSTAANADAAWAKANGFGPEAAAQDWAAIEAAAKKEGKVTIYSVSSRVNKLAEAFTAKYGIQTTASDMSSDVQMEKFRREYKAGQRNVDVLYNNEAPSLIEEFAPQGMVWNFVPDNVKDQLAENEMSPFLVHRWSSRILFYNTNKHGNTPPLDNLWDLTTEAWKGKVIMPDPLGSAVQASVLQTILQNPDLMAKAYEKEFGKPVEFSEDVIEAVSEIPTLSGPDASIEWMYRFFQNEPVSISSTNKIFENVSTVGQENPPIGFVTFSKLRDTEAGKFESRAAYGVEPAMGVAFPTVLAVADQAPNPNAAKLLIRFMMEEEGFEPWNVIGDYASRADIEAKQLTKHDMPAFDKAGFLVTNPSEVYNTKFTFLQLLLSLK